MSEKNENQEQQPSQPEQKPAGPKTTQREKPVVQAPPKPSTLSASPSAPVQAQIRNRHDTAFRHDVFMSDAKDAVRNVSFQHLKPELVRVPHKHVYHSHNNQGKKLLKTGSAAGHWHNVEHYVDPRTGEIIAKCGPAMHEVTLVTQTGRVISRVEQVSFEEEKQNGDIVRHVDDHTHELTYLGSEELSPLGIQKDLKEQRAAAAAMGISFGQESVTDNTPKPLTAADGVTMT